MTPDAVQDALGKHLVLGTGKKVVVPNKAATTLPAMPYLVMQNAARDDIDNALAGGKGYSQGRQVVVVVALLNDFTTDADRLAATVKGLFPKGKRLGNVTIRNSSIQSGYPTDRDWRVPVIIDWIAT